MRTAEETRALRAASEARLRGWIDNRDPAGAARLYGRLIAREERRIRGYDKELRKAAIREG